MISVDGQNFREGNFAVRQLNYTELPYMNSSWPRDALPPNNPVATYVVNGRVYPHPVAQIQRALGALAAYEKDANGNKAVWLNIARVNARYLLTSSTTLNGATYFPYPFEYTYDGELLRPPWYSAMAQGQGLSLFVRMYQVTGEMEWLRAAESVLISLKQVRNTNRQVWTIGNQTDLLWYEEVLGHRIFNGHIFAALGLYDYWWLTGDSEALEIFRASLVTVQDAFPKIRVPGWVSQYSTEHFAGVVSYHEVHTQLMMWLYQITGDTWFAKAAELLLEDYTIARKKTLLVVIRPGTYSAFKFDWEGNIRERSMRTYTTTVTPLMSRVRIQNRSGYWLVDDKGFAIQEMPPVVYVRDFVPITIDFEKYDPPRPVRFAKGEHTGVTFGRFGSIASAKKVNYTNEVVESMTKLVIFNSRWHILMSSGDLAGYYVPVTDMLILE